MSKETSAQLTEISREFNNNFQDGAANDLMFWVERFNMQTEQLANAKQVVPNKIFQNKLVLGTKKALSTVKNEFSNSKKGQEISLIALKATSQILESILDFEKEMDKAFPGGSDIFVNFAGYAITGLLTYVAPMTTSVLKLTGTLDKLTDEFKKDNLDKNIKSIKAKIAKLEGNELLASQYEEAKAQAEIQKATKQPVSVIQQLGFENVKDLQKFTKEPKEVIRVVSVAASYAKKTFKKTREEIAANIDLVKKEIKTELAEIENENNALDKPLSTVNKELDNIMLEANELLNDSLSKNFFDRVQDQQQIAEDILKKVNNAIDKSFSQHELNKNTIDKIKNNVKKIVNEKISGDVEKLVSSLKNNYDNVKKESKVKRFIKKYLPISQAFKVKINRIIQSKGTQQISI
ncbi:MAG: hypothetical protein HRU35_07005 [Rickettsiaceae bacterium]|nr:hypothetical protein [Rickettsiaceae bacterium]